MTYPLMIGIQLASTRIGRITGKGFTETFARLCPRWIVLWFVGLLVVANVINLGADVIRWVTRPGCSSEAEEYSSRLASAWPRCCCRFSCLTSPTCAC